MSIIEQSETLDSTYKSITKIKLFSKVFYYKTDSTKPLRNILTLNYIISKL